MWVEVLEEGVVVKTIVATAEFAELQHPGAWRFAEHQGGTSVQQPAPVKVSRRQARQVLLIEGLLDQVEPAIQAIADPMQRQLALIEWQDSLEFERHRPLLVTLGAALGLDEAALDQLFITAATL